LHHPNVLQLAQETQHTAAQVMSALELHCAASAGKAALGLFLPSCEQTLTKVCKYCL